ncbi:MAG TPA: hypothetical protein DD641_07885 [Deltaproteobacteria bacterium]|nr:hypothetical protein [Deltaproteobacteria bacterium]
MWYEKPMREKVIFFLTVGLCLLTVLSSVTFGGEDFLSEYWKRPIPIQNPNPPLIPPFFKGAGAHPKDGRGGLSLHPEACGECHKEQYNGWKGSLHSKAVGPGLLGQLPGTDFKSVPGNPEFAMSCYFCHAPMEEQNEMKKGSRVKGQGSKDKGQGENGYIKNPNFDSKLKISGVSCSVCHLRDGKIYGPPPVRAGVRAGTHLKDGWGSKGKGKEQKPHNGFIEKAFFEKAEFCAACHQLDEGYELNGKILTNTYREWQESIYGKNNITCQNCHMPDRRHLFRGIHDSEMVKRGITITAVRTGNKAKLIIKNTGTGHCFPTYVTPLVVVKGFMIDKKGRVIKSSLKESYIGRHVSLDLSEELFDTRIPPNKRFEFDYLIDKSYNNAKIVFEVWVYPDEFYNRFFENLFNDISADINREEIAKALKITKTSGYVLFKEAL